MDHPYANLPDSSFWRRAVSSCASDEVDPVTHVPFKIGPQDPVATAGSCFAQHLSRTLAKSGYNFLVTEPTPQTPGALDEGFGVYPARFGNIYTVAQLLQLFERAYGIFAPRDEAWQREDGRYVDPLRPQVQPSGFGSIDEVREDRIAHLRAVREMFESCKVFIFTLGLTESWHSTADGCVVPLAPGVVGRPTRKEKYRFKNYSIPEMVRDMVAFTDHLRVVRPDVEILLTVSPVPLIATYAKRHVLASTILSKSLLRVAAERMRDKIPEVEYFPSYEIITGPHASYFSPDLRSVTEDGVSHVMRVFSRHFLSDTPVLSTTRRSARSTPHTDLPSLDAERSADLDVICDEEALDA